MRPRRLRFPRPKARTCDLRLETAHPPGRPGGGSGRATHTAPPRGTNQVRLQVSGDQGTSPLAVEFSPEPERLRSNDRLGGIPVPLHEPTSTGDPTGCSYTRKYTKNSGPGRAENTDVCVVQLPRSPFPRLSDRRPSIGILPVDDAEVRPTDATCGKITSPPRASNLRCGI